jgi:SOS-response transcriptional repressor LexA
MKNDSKNKKTALSPEQLAEASKLKAIWLQKKSSLGLTQELAAEKLGISQTGASHYLNGSNALNLKAAVAFSGMLEVSIGDFSPRLEHERLRLAGAGEAEDENTSPLKRESDLVPVISWVQAGAFCESPDLFSPGDAEEWLPCPSRHSRGTYALRVKNDSMTSLSQGERSYPHGTIIFVDPERAHTVGSRVIARLPGSSETTFKVYTEDGGQPYLMPINPKYPSIPVPEGTVICGVVIGSYWPE